MLLSECLPLSLTAVVFVTVLFLQGDNYRSLV